jgi:hypothetical protein
MSGHGVDAKYMALVTAFIEVALRRHPELAAEVLELAAYYENHVFVMHAPVAESMRQAAERVIGQHGQRAVTPIGPRP